MIWRGTSFVFLLFGCVAQQSRAADWPQFRHDAQRSAASPEQLPAELHVQWSRDFATPKPAFPTEVRLRYDGSYEPVVVGKTLFIPSMVTDSVTAFDTDTGAERWRFFANGPVRFAPVAWQNKVYFTSDDGHLYCVNAEHGKLLWKVRGLPADRKDRWILGNGRLISLWPARGGPVLADGIVYFAAGIWPQTGIFVHAIDAATGEAVWSNKESSHLAATNLDHGIKSHAGLTPQGYLAISEEKLVVPCGAQLPAMLDRKSGKLDKYTLGWGGRVGLPKGSWFVASAGKYLTHSGDLYDTSQPNEEKFRDSRGRPDFKSQLYVGGFTRLQIDPSNQRALNDFRVPVMTQQAMYYTSHLGNIEAYDLTSSEIKPRTKATSGVVRVNDRYPDKSVAVFRQQWTLPSKLRVHIKAGQRLYAGGDGVVAAVDIPTAAGNPAIGWQAKIEGTPNGMIAADGKLFLVTREGRLYAFGAKTSDEPLHYAKPKGEPLSVADEWTKRAGDFLKDAQVTDGYVWILGVTNGRLIEELVKQSKCTVIAVDSDAEKIARLREQYRKAGWYGSRVVLIDGEPQQLPPYFAQMILMEDFGQVKKEFDRSSLAPVFRSLRPYGGKAYLAIPVDYKERAMAECQRQGLNTRSNGPLLIASKDGPVQDSADWSHRGANAANAGGSQDASIKGPLSMLWFDGSVRWNRKPGSAEVRVAGGRMFILASDLLAIDVYTGQHLWRVKLPAGVSTKSDFIATEDAVYFSAGNQCVELDAKTARTTRHIDISKQSSVGTNRLTNLRVSETHVFATIGRQLVCVDRKTAKLLWSKETGRPALSVAVGGGKVFCAELPDRRRQAASSSEVKTMAFDPNSGKLLWEVKGGSPLRYSAAHDLLFAAHGVFKGADGSRVREGGAFASIVGNRLIRTDNQVLTTYDLLTGLKQGNDTQWSRRGCTGLRASVHMATTRYLANAAYMDLETRKITPLYNIRSGCNNNLFPADGVLNVPNLTGGCECNYTPTSMALIPDSVLKD
jgi:outer membrane protein assembly factor BamB